jgi:hypothetical protein
MKKYLRCVVCLPLCLFLFGCSRGHPTAPVSGTVTYKGKPVAFGKVTFIDKEGRAGFGPLQNGQYSFRAPVGDCRVGVTSRDLEPPPEERKGAKMVRPGMYIGKSHIPEKYESPDHSGLTFTVENKDNKKDWNLTD